MASLRENWLLVPYSAQKKSCQFPSSKPEGQNFKFDGMVFSKSCIGWTKNCGRGFISWHWKAMESFGKKWLQVFNSAQEKFYGFCSSEPEGRDFIFDVSGFSKRYIGSAKNCGTSFILLHWKAIESFGKKWIQVCNWPQKKSVNFVSCQVLALSPARRIFTIFG